MSLSKKYIGIKDLLDEQRYRIAHLQEELIKHEIPGSNWHSYQNVYNLVNGAYPNDAYTFIFLSEFLDIDIKIILNRFSEKQVFDINKTYNLSELKLNNQWDIILEAIQKDYSLLNQLTPYELTWQLIKHKLVENGIIQPTHSFNNIEAIKGIIDLCLKNGMVGLTIPQASVFKQFDQITKLLSEGHDINELDFGQRTGLMVSALLNDKELVKFHLNNGAFISFSDQDNLQAIHLTTSHEIIDLLKEKRENKNSKIINSMDHVIDFDPKSEKIVNTEEDYYPINHEEKLKSDNLDNMSVDMLFKKELLSVRAYNCCRRGNLQNVNDIVEYYNINKSFMNIYNCGLKAELELVSLVKRYSPKNTLQ